jgi:hypothetical protein
VNNTIVWGNTAGSSGKEIYTYHSDCNVTLNHCTYGNAPGDVEGNGTVTPHSCLSLDPLFVNAALQDYHLQSGSPCIDAGDNSLIPTGVSTDLDGNMRIANGTVDIGAYEYGSTPPSGYCWTRRMGAGSVDKGEGICTDGNGNVYVTGFFQDEVDFAEDWAGSEIKSGWGAFVTKIGADGGYCWTHRVSGSGSETVCDICSDASGNIYLTGYFSGTVNFADDWGLTDEKTCVGGFDIFITSIDTDGGYCWTRRIGGSSGCSETGYAICADSSGNVYVAGYFGDTVNFAQDWGGDDTKTGAGAGDAFITKIDAGGAYCWTHRIGGGEGDYGNSICTDKSGNVYLLGSFGDTTADYTVNFAEDWGGTDEKTRTCWEDIFITKINAGGAYCWTRRMGGEKGDRGNAICSDPSGNIYVTGRFGYNTENYTVNFAEDWGGNDPKVSAGRRDIFVTKIGSDGGYRWTRRMGGPDEDDVAMGICADVDCNVYVTGYFRSATVNFAEDWGNNDIKTSVGISDIFVTKITASGDYASTRRMGASGDDEAHAICVDESGNIYIAGFFLETTNFAEDWGETDEKTSAGSKDIFVTKITQP